MQIVSINKKLYYKVPHVNLDGTTCHLYIPRIPPPSYSRFE